METKTIILSEKEGKRQELHLFEIPEKIEFGFLSDIQAKIMGAIIHNRLIYSGPVSDFLLLPNKEEIAEKVCEVIEINEEIYETCYKVYNSKGWGAFTAVKSLMSAIGEYPYIIITESEI